MSFPLCSQVRTSGSWRARYVLRVNSQACWRSRAAAPRSSQKSPDFHRVKQAFSVESVQTRASVLSDCPCRPGYNGGARLTPGYRCPQEHSAARAEPDGRMKLNVWKRSDGLRRRGGTIPALGHELLEL